MNHQEAGVFLQRLFKEVFEQGDVARVTDYYHEDFVGHFNDGTFSRDDAAQRVRLLNELCPNRKRFEVTQHYCVPPFLFCKCRQSWLSPQQNQLCESHVFVVYRLRGDKIAEAWVMVEGTSLPYQEINAQFEDFLSQYELSQQGKEAFFTYLSDFEYFYQQGTVSLTSREQEVLFYYLRGFTAKEIANEMHRSYRTIEGHIAAILEKYDCNSKLELRNRLFRS